MFTYEKLDIPKLGLSGLEESLSEEERAIQDVCHRFARDVMRPIGIELDKMTPEEAVAEGSPLFDYLQQIQELGLLDLNALSEMSNEQKSRLLPMVFEELGWGDPGLALANMVASMAAFTAHQSGDPDLIELCDGKIGCWLGTQPDRGSEVVDIDATDCLVGQRQGKGSLLVSLDGDELVINGQSAAWVSLAPIAQIALAYIPFDDGSGVYRDTDPGLHHIAVFIPLDLPGVTRGKPLHKIGQRSLPQGEIYFDNVRVPRKYGLAEKDDCTRNFLGVLTFANMEMGATFTGVTRAAYELALEYVHERKQGGGPIIKHQSVQMRMFDLWQRTEAVRAMSHRACRYNYSDNGPHLLASITSKTFVTRNAFEVASDALQLFGANGLTKEYPIEKIMRDARASMIEDGENNVLNLKGMYWLSRWYQETTGITV
jgi:acyl-CoA dehydrogenase